jgi:hypothetical protein
MSRLVFRIVAVAIAIAAISQLQSAQAFGHFRMRCRPCWQPCQPCRPCRGEDYTCLQAEVYEYADDDIVYNAYYYEGGCDVEPVSVYYEGDSFPVPEICENGDCISGGFRGKDSKVSPTKTFPGLPHPLDPGFTPPLSPGCSIKVCYFECLELLAEHKKYKVKVIGECCPHSSRMIYTAYEIDHFPDGINPWPIKLCCCNCKKLDGGYAYSLTYNCRHELLLTAD